MTARVYYPLRPHLIVLTLFVGVLTAAGALAADLPDVTLEPVRWQEFHSLVRNVAFDRNGRAWFEIEGRATLDEVKRRVESAVDEKCPRLMGAYIVRFDKKGRIWLRLQNDQKLLLCFDPAKKSWQERRFDDAIALKDMSRRVSVWESANGTLYFGSWYGVYILDGDEWSYQPLYEANDREKKYLNGSRSFNQPEFAEDKDGRIFVWSNWGSSGWAGTLGFFVHHNGKWRQIRGGGDQALEEVGSLTPLGDAIFVCPQSGFAFLVRPPRQETGPPDIESISRDISLLGSEQFANREAAEKRLMEQGSAIVPVLQQAQNETNDPEILQRLRRITSYHSWEGWSPGGAMVDGHTFSFTRGRQIDESGALWFSADTIILPTGEKRRGGFWRISPQHKVLPLPQWATSGERVFSFVDSRSRVYAGSYELGCMLIERDQMKAVTDDTQKLFDQVLGEDITGRVYLNGSGQVAAFCDRFPDPRRTLASTSFKLEERSPVCARDSNGKVWAKLADPAGLISVFEWDAWRHYPPPDGARIQTIDVLQPLAESRLILAQQHGLTRAYLFDGEKWTPYKNLRHLVETEYSQLSDLIDNRQASAICVDDQKRIWLTELYTTAVYDGQGWVDVSADIKKTSDRFNSLRCVPIDAGRAMLLSDTTQMLRVSMNGSYVSHKPFLLNDTKAIHDKVHILENAKEVLIPAHGRYLTDDLCYRIRDGQTDPLKDTGYPKLVDSDGNVWFAQGRTHKLVVLSPDDARCEFVNENIYWNSCWVAEQSPRDFWVTTRLGLAHVKKQATSSGNSLTINAEYTKNIPRQCRAMYLDAGGYLWLQSRELRESKLWRIQLPRLQLPDASR
jgi:streptogramin lyase